MAVTELQQSVINRLCELFVWLDEIDIMMYLTNWDEKMPLDWERLAEFEDIELAHDLAGIAKYTNTETGEINTLFRPYAAKKGGR